jgi:hypothetical protein
MRLLISFCLLLMTGLALLREGRTVVLVWDLPPAEAVAAAGAADVERRERPEGQEPPRPWIDCQVLSEVALDDTCSGGTGVDPYPAEVLAWLAAESRRRGAEGVTCIFGFFGRASGFQGNGKILRFGDPGGGAAEVLSEH